MLMQSFTVTFKKSIDNMFSFRNTMASLFKSYMWKKTAFLFYFDMKTSACPSDNQVSSLLQEKFVASSLSRCESALTSIKLMQFP